ncbi:hypothetical protein [Pedomonas mirosovicensis]|uniref:hypothetical protein n=1 Tax=Pedomonas mirosovicensis TaxID=2908641 RepID=UPI002168E948|nr:hypothetical protein [Pedomonas mirosovicensis]MCH8683804.1 hypothetical protein [Pedomonas mirosovicensis]
MLDHDLLQRLMTLLAELPSRRPHPGLPRELDLLFDRLRQEEPSPSAHEVEDLIWQVWAEEEDVAAGDGMEAAIRALALRDLDEAELLLDRLAENYPTWPEVYNKRATLHFIDGEDNLALADILRTLELEPRHFGALAGLGQICLRNGEPEAAAAAFHAAMRVNPHLIGAQALVEDLNETKPMLN